MTKTREDLGSCIGIVLWQKGVYLLGMPPMPCQPWLLYPVPLGFLLGWSDESVSKPWSAGQVGGLIETIYSYTMLASIKLFISTIKVPLLWHYELRLIWSIMK
jgi:hypothetical protein